MYGDDLQRVLLCGLTFDFSSGWKQAKLAGRRPLDAAVLNCPSSRLGDDLERLKQFATELGLLGIEKHGIRQF